MSSNFLDPIAEMRMLAACIDHPEYTLRLRPELFTNDMRCQRKTLYKAMHTAFLRYGELTSEGIEHIYGSELPAELEIARGARPDPIMDRLVFYATKRQLALIGDKINTLLVQPSLELGDVRTALQFDPLTADADTSLLSGAAEFVSDLTRKRNGQYQFVDTGLGFLNFMLGGEWPRKGLTVILGEGGAGKTALICNSMKLMAQNGLPSFFASLEMPKDRLYSRLVADEASIDGMRIKNGDVTDEELKRIDQSMLVLNELPIYIDHTPGATVDYIVNQIRHHKERYNIQSAFIDYLQIIGGADDRDNTSELYGHFAQELRNAGTRYDLSIILLSQQNRASQGMHSILGSGRVGHIADAVVELKKAETPNLNNPVRPIDVIMWKNRDGGLGSQTVAYNAPFLRFSRD